LWAIGKIAHLIVREETINREVQAALIRCLESSKEQVSNTAYSTLDEIICCSPELPFCFPSIASCLTKGIRGCLGKPLSSIFSTCSTLYEKHSAKIPPEVTRTLVGELATKW
jgi:hypothetical protein